MTKVDTIPGTNYAFQYTNYRERSEPEYQQALMAARYEGLMRGDSRSPRVSKMVYDRVDIVRIFEHTQQMGHA
jgi:hypothetical protein